jgi:hypothetical protein
MQPDGPHSGETPVEGVMDRQRLNRLQIAELFAIASGRRRGTSESEQIEAANKLHCELRLQIAEFQRPNPLWFWQDEPFWVFDERKIDPLLNQLIADWGRYIFAQENPTFEVARFFGKRKKPGKRAKNMDRDFSIAGAVVTKMESGMRFEEACEEVASHYGLKDGTIKKIYVRRNKEVRAARHQI